MCSITGEKDAEFRERKRQILQQGLGLLMDVLKAMSYRCNSNRLRLHMAFLVVDMLFLMLYDVILMCRTHLVKLPDNTVVECHFTIGLYVADLFEKWDLLNLEHKSSIKHIIPKSDYTNLAGSFPRRTEGRVERVSSLTSFTLGYMACGQCLSSISRHNHAMLQIWDLHDQAKASNMHGWKTATATMLKPHGLVGGPVSVLADSTSCRLEVTSAGPRQDNAQVIT